MRHTKQAVLVAMLHRLGPLDAKYLKFATKTRNLTSLIKDINRHLKDFRVRSRLVYRLEPRQ